MSHEDFYEQEYNKRFDFGLWRKVLVFMRPYRAYVISLAGVMMFVGMLDAIYPLLTKIAIDHFIVPRQTDGLGLFGLVFMLLNVMLGLVVWLLITLAGKVNQWICYDIRQAGFKKLQQLSFSYFDRTHVGWLMARMGSDVSRLGNILAWGVVDIVWGHTMMLAIAAVMFYLNWKLALIVLSVVPPLVWISGVFQKRILSSYRTVRKTNSKITGAFNEGITGAKTTKTLVREQANLTEFEGLTDTMFKSSVLAAVQSATYLPLVLLLGAIGSALAVWFGGSGVIHETITYGTLVAFISYATRFFEPVQEVARVFAELQNAQASAERIFTLIETEPEIVDGSEVRESLHIVPAANYLKAHPNGNGNGHMPDFHLTQTLGNSSLKNEARGLSGIEKNSSKEDVMAGRVEFRNVCFGYKNGRAVLDNFNLIVEAGETIALVGETGSGKSTIVNLACRFYEPTAGHILIDGTDYRQRSLHWLQSNLGVVLQTPHLFGGTILENIRYGRLEATDEEVIGAAQVVHADAFIRNFEKGYQNQVGEGGSLLSTGQKQLISFARALLANPRLFVMDEATSSVDTETEQLIQKAIGKVLENRTSFIIAHRLSTIRAADRILVIDQGKILESGNHHELIHQRGRYYHLYTNQFQQEAIADFTSAE